MIFSPSDSSWLPYEKKNVRCAQSLRNVTLRHSMCEKSVMFWRILNKICKQYTRWIDELLQKHPKLITQAHSTKTFSSFEFATVRVRLEEIVSNLKYYLLKFRRNAVSWGFLLLCIVRKFNWVTGSLCWPCVKSGTQFENFALGSSWEREGERESRCVRIH